MILRNNINKNFWGDNSVIVLKRLYLLRKLPEVLRAEMTGYVGLAPWFIFY